MHSAQQCAHSVDVALSDRLKEYILGDTFPCLGARSAINTGRARFGAYGALGCGSPHRIQSLCDALAEFSDAFPEPGESPVTFIAMFDDDIQSEKDFEERLWTHLQMLHAHDGAGWADGVSSDPESPNFSFSMSGRAFFVVGLHPHASRIARRAPVPCLVFNFHDQFEQFRASGKYEKMQRVIRARDVAIQGDINPTLENFGEGSAAKQYSGRAVNDEWRCPFIPRVANAK